VSGPGQPALVTWLGHATVLLEIDGVRLVTDPVLGKRAGPLVRIAGRIDRGTPGRVDAVLLSHLHADHADVPSLRRFGDVPVCAPAGSGAWLRGKRLSDVRELRPGQVTAVGALRVEATPAEHSGKRAPLGPEAATLGYLVGGSTSVYFAGDTDLFDAMSELAGRVDVALLPVSGWGPTLGPGHLDPERAAQAAAAIAPRVAIPIHWGTLALPRPARRLADPWRPALDFAALCNRDAPDVQVRVLAPGESTAVGPYTGASARARTAGR
jgi:L-ascorbate metabolism protein UlaG (beta-lactamase superfamily)